MTAGQATVFSLQVALIGMAIVFIALIVLVFLFKIMSFVVTRAKSDKRKDAPSPAHAVPAPVVPPVAAPILKAAQQDEEDEIAAVIAAVTALCQDSGNGLVVRSVRHIGKNAPAWNLAGRQDSILN